MTSSMRFKTADISKINICFIFLTFYSDNVGTKKRYGRTQQALVRLRHVMSLIRRGDNYNCNCNNYDNNKTRRILQGVQHFHVIYIMDQIW